VAASPTTLSSVHRTVSGRRIKKRREARRSLDEPKICLLLTHTDYG
jgi:hypothetical protein